MSDRRLKVYGWTALLSNDERVRLGFASWIIQARAIVAASSKAEVGRLLGEDPRQLFNLSETGNAVEVSIATMNPRRFFASKLDGPKVFHEVPAESLR